MRKNRIICFMVILSLLLSSSAFALGNDFTFSNDWYLAVVENSSYLLYPPSGSAISSVVRNDSSSWSDDGFVLFDGNVVGAEGSLDTIPNTASPFVYFYKDISNIERMTFNSPLSVTVRNGQTLNINLLLLLTSNYSYDVVNGTEVRFTLSNGSVVTGVKSQKVSASASIGSIELDYSGKYTGFDKEYSGTGNMIMASWTNNTGEDVVVSYITTKWTSQYIDRNFTSNIYYGFFCESGGKSVVLPSYVEDNFSMISSSLINIDNDFDEALSELASIKAELIALADKLNQSGSTTNNYYQTITQATEEQIVKQEQLDELVATARSELEEMKEVIQSVTVPTASDVSSATTSQATQLSIDDALGNQDLNQIFSTLFQNSTISTMLLMVVSIATVGYVLFGKRG